MGRFFLLPPLAAALVAIVCAMAGIALVSGRRARMLAPVSGLLLAGVAVFGLIPEVLHQLGWRLGLPLTGAGFGSLFLLQRLEERFAGSLVAATALHAFIDGWGMVAVAGHVTPAMPQSITIAVIAAMLLHKVPEGLALGAMLRAAAPRLAVPLAIAAELPTLFGGAAGKTAVPASWVNYPLAIAAGVFLFLGVHSRHAHGGVLCRDGETVAKHPGY